MLGSMTPARRAGWRMGGAIAAAALLALGACGGSVVVDSSGGGAAKATGTGTGGGTGGVTTASASSTDVSVGVTAVSVGAVASSSSGGACSPPCGFQLTCCGGTCAELDNDLLNCGGCGVVCPGPHPYCHKGVCEPGPMCQGGQPCPSTDFCCGSQCCGAGEICCDSYGGPVQANPHCEMPVNGTCHKSCFVCN